MAMPLSCLGYLLNLNVPVDAVGKGRSSLPEARHDARTSRASTTASKNGVGAASLMRATVRGVSCTSGSGRS